MKRSDKIKNALNDIDTDVDVIIFVDILGIGRHVFDNEIEEDKILVFSTVDKDEVYGFLNSVLFNSPIENLSFIVPDGISDVKRLLNNFNTYYY